MQSINSMVLSKLNQTYRLLSPTERIISFYTEFGHKNILCSSSFGTNSVLLLFLISKHQPNQKIYFIDTGNHFSETITYKNELVKYLGLNVKVITAPIGIHQMTALNETWKTDPEYCCYLKKVKPMETLKKKNDVWISGLMEWQSDHRAGLDIFEQRKGILKFHPLLDLTESASASFIIQNDLPRHPLVEKGYHSVGCTHCTVAGESRSGRWQGIMKTECGLHI